MRKIAVIYGSRADQSPLTPLINALADNAVCVHMDKGLYDNEAFLLESLKEIKPDIVVLLGDRYETLVAASVAALLAIPIAHLSGGDTTEGAVDENFRHAITKLSYWHFPICELHAERIIQMGESPDRVFTLGAPAVDLLAEPVMSREECEAELGIKLKSPMALVCYHPETLGEDRFNEIDNLAKDYATFIVSGSNADPGGDEINKRWKDSGYAFGPSYPLRLWQSLMRHADVLIGNSSGFIIEGMTLGKKFINIGDRQKGRYEDALGMFAKDRYPFGKPGEVGPKIAEKLMSPEIPSKPRKQFHAV